VQQHHVLRRPGDRHTEPGVGFVERHWRHPGAICAILLAGPARSGGDATG
jgi:hypothetical protein